MTLKIYNPLTQKAERFKPLNDGQVAVYVCGPVMDDHLHLGHAKTYLTMDVVVRYFRYQKYRVRYVRNLADIDHTCLGTERPVRGAWRERLDPMEVVDTYLQSCQEDMDALKLLRPNISPRASGHILDIITWIQALLDLNVAYEVDGNIYFDVTTTLQASSLSAANEKPEDFALWRRAESNCGMYWPSPWGDGVPGWHIECATMASKYLGDTFDVHGGASERQFSHNQCQAVLADAYHTGKPFANYWMLIEPLTVNGAKMSKDLGNFLTVKDALKLYAPEAIRYFILGGHYRSTLEFSREGLQTAQHTINRMLNTMQRVRYHMKDAKPAGTAVLAHVAALEDYRLDFNAAMEDDFNTPQTLVVLQDFIKEVNRQLENTEEMSAGTLSAIEKILQDLAGSILGLLPEQTEERQGNELINELIRVLIDLREDARAARDWSRSDVIRSRLSELGILLEDSSDGPTWRIK